MNTPSLRQWLLAALLLCVTLALGLVGYTLSEHLGLKAQADAGARQLELHTRAVESELDKYTYLPSVLELEHSVQTLLSGASDASIAPVNQYLEGLRQRSGSRAIFLMDASGHVLASSNWRDPDSFIGEDLAFRPYFKDALQGRPGRFYGLGTTTGEAGYFLAHGLRAKGGIVGVAVVKVRLDALEARWQKARLEAFVSDENGIIILSSDATRRLKSVEPLNEESRTRLARSLQYYGFPLDELQFSQRESVGPGAERLILGQDDGYGDRRPARYLAQSLAVIDTPWHLTLLTPLKDQRRESIVHGVLVAFGFALLVFLLIARNERRKVVATRLAAREALEAANDLLEKRIADRTEALRNSNERLKSQIRERRQAEQTLRKAQDELVRAEKLATIGQMSTSIAHELNQPLAALRTLSGNTIRFLERGHLEVADTNLRTINDLVDRMGRIIATLRAFARGGDRGGQAEVASALGAARGVLQQRFENRPIRLDCQVTPGCVEIEQTRLEQILVNLLSNALDAVESSAQPVIEVRGQVIDDSYRLRVSDNGTGIDTQGRQRLFEPFFTTKLGGHGLGLGLTLSAQLAAAAKGQLSLDEQAGSGASFLLTLPLSAVSNRSTSP